jgi:Eco57I restriction-modification methylase
MLARIKPLDHLADEMINNIPQHVWQSSSTTFADLAMGGGQFIKQIIAKLRYYGHSDENIRNRVYGYEYNQALINLSVNMNKLIGTFTKISYNDILKADNNMPKFDVIIGNPPYQFTREDGSRGDKAKNLWSKFVYKGLNLLKDDGYIGMIVPNSWLSPSADIGKGQNGVNFIRDYFKKGQLIAVNINECSRHFPRQNLAFSYFVYRNTPADKFATSVQTVNETFDVDFRDINYFPNEITSHSVSIMNKLLFSELEKFPFVSTNYKGMVVDITKDGPYNVFHTSAKDGIKKSSVPSDNHKNKKVIISSSSVYAPYYDDGQYSCSAMTMSCVFPNDADMDNVKSILSSNLYQYVVKHTLFGGWVSYEAIRRLPKLDITRRWTDEEIYAIFNLTQDEIADIESYVYEDGKHPKKK